ncbi:MAG: HlyD family efflux transporter periplasmic adaptor subunit [Bacteroidetes bacterium]|nr:HlyD family efflux transporter periplasmic adaptor subunit [Bacteroidota bacterium]
MPIEIESIHSDEIADIMSQMPSWLIRRGVAILLGIVLLLLAGTWFIHYPDIVQTQVSIYSESIPVTFVAKSSGKILRIFKRNGDIVHKGDVICLIENPADYDDVLHLAAVLQSLEKFVGSEEPVNEIPVNGRLQLGEMQPTYSDLMEAINQFNFYRKNQFAARKIVQLRKQIRYQDELNTELGRKDSLLKLQLGLGRVKFNADSSLASEKVIAPLELDNSKNELIGRQMSVDAIRPTIIQNNLQQTEYLKTIADLEQQELQQESDYRERIRQDVKKLRGEYAIWEQNYIMKSPVEGKVTFFRIWKENQYVHSGEGILMVVPPIEKYVARAMLPVQGAGKVRSGQMVSIKLAAFPYQEFGIIRGRVSQISSVALDSSYGMEIVLENGLRTNINRIIPPQSQISGTADVFTNNKSIFQRIFENVWIANKR